MRRSTLVLGSLIVLLALGLGCDDRGTNLQVVDLGDMEGQSGVFPLAVHAYPYYLTLQLLNRFELLEGAAYVPSEAIGPNYRPVPSLVLLAPEGGNKLHYFRAGLAQLMQELTAAGKVQPMVVLCIANDQRFGGYFYADSDPAGHYDSIFHYDGRDAVPDDLVDYIHFAFPATIDEPQKRGIGGIGQGAYGAFRAAIKNPGQFGSISVADGPLDFDGPNGSAGLRALIDDCLAEQLAHYNADPRIGITEIDSSVVPWDTTYSSLPFSFRTDFDSSRTMPISQMFIGGSLAFSPDDTLLAYTRTVIESPGLPGGGRIEVEVDSRARISDGLPPVGTEWETLITGIVKGDLLISGVPEGFDFHLPFDSAGDVYPPIWSRWMANNLDSLHQQAANSLDNVNIWVATNAGARWSYDQMTQSWLAYLRSQNVPFEEYKYSGYTDEVVEGDEFLFDLLREMLIFHSESFGD